MEEAYLFVYGTLLTGAASREVTRLLMVHARDLGPATLQARLYDLGPYPGAVPSARPEDRVRGRLLRLRQAGRVIPRLDRYEGYRADAEPAGEFVRRLATVVREAGAGPQAAWVYYYNRAVDRRVRITTGDYARWRRACR
jgi:gamma-glutamylcyclotransferase (GGCT)/AIG2-like uncharacterized protein YtfP